MLVSDPGYGKTHERFFYPLDKAKVTGLTRVAHFVSFGSSCSLFKLGAIWADSSISLVNTHQRLLNDMITSKTSLTLKICFAVVRLVSQINFVLTGSFRSFQTSNYTTYTSILDF